VAVTSLGMSFEEVPPPQMIMKGYRE